VPAAASPPVGSPPQYSPALRWVTTGFGMGPGGASTLSATGTPHPPTGGFGTPCLRRQSRGMPLPRSCPLARAPCPATRPTPPSPRISGTWEPSPEEGSPLTLARAAPPPGHAPGRQRMQDLRPRPLGRLGSSRLPAVHLPPINPVICRGSYLTKSGDARLGEGFPLRCFQRFARPHVATQRCRSRDNWHTSGASTPVLSY
jgi:hypothetical protein